MSKGLSSYIKHLQEVALANNYQFAEGTINLPFDTDVVSLLTSVKEKLVSSKLRHILVIGEGGSILGARAIYDALHGFTDAVELDRYPKMVFEDTNDAARLHTLHKFLKALKAPSEVLINVISKSGKTTETITNLEVLLGGLPHLKKRLVITTDYESPLWHEAKAQKITTLPVPKMVGGRYSVFSSVGIFPLLCAGVNIYALLEGAMQVRDACIKADVQRNPALISAISTYINNLGGKTVNVSFYFHPELESLGKWYKQLHAESLGKKGLGMTPIVSIGTSDLHSLGQLYLGGPADKFFTFVSAKGHAYNMRIPANPSFGRILGDVGGLSTEQITLAIFQGVKKTFANVGLPFVEIEFEEIAEKSLGKYMQFKMLEVMYLAQLMGVNAFDQPDVEAYKSEARKILSALKK